ncbi:tRNA (adenosine(37)-N6)-threonylcarbamoyltransferase complex ATPase subunit type 1 TsaE [Candidatus Saccharibacteria bacterium]|nr:tRNA (adenosine(37)-N6)-threonylcarbamoyltransferase complex ATPase subunit type 1 TsaE [Candidatus Saccharibacteria bacterium]
MKTGILVGDMHTVHTVTIATGDAMEAFGRQLGVLLRGGEVFALNGDVGTGKTTMTKGLAAGMGITEVVQSPTFTIERLYDAPEQRQLAHYDFYRLADAGIMRAELEEALTTPGNVVVIEWNEIIRDVLPESGTIICDFAYDGETGRRLTVTVPERFDYLLPVLKKETT